MKNFFDKYGKELNCSECPHFTLCLDKKEPQCASGYMQFQDDKIAILEEKLSNAIIPKFKPNNDLFVIVGHTDETKAIEQYYIDEIVIRGDGKLIEYRDIEQETIIGENNLLFATYEEAQERLKNYEKL